MLHEILTGQPLHSRRPASTPPRDDVPPELAFICRRATEPARDGRISAAGDLADAVQRYLDGDRDLALRQGLARKHLDAAHAALAGAGDDEARRHGAMREAGPALALDPSLAGAAELVSRLMLSPPARTPALIFSFVTLVACAGSVAHAVSRHQYRAREQLEVQAWKLRQLL